MRIGDWTHGKLSRWADEKIESRVTRGGLLVAQASRGASDAYWQVTETTSATDNGAAFNFLLFNDELEKYFGGPYRLYPHIHLCKGQSVIHTFKADLTDIDAGVTVGLSGGNVFTCPGTTACATKTSISGWRSANSVIPSINFPTTSVVTMNINFWQTGASNFPELSTWAITAVQST